MNPLSCYYSLDVRELLCYASSVRTIGGGHQKVKSKEMNEGEVLLLLAKTGRQCKQSNHRKRKDGFCRDGVGKLLMLR